MFEESQAPLPSAHVVAYDPNPAIAGAQLEIAVVRREPPIQHGRYLQPVPAHRDRPWGLLAPVSRIACNLDFHLRLPLNRPESLCRTPDGRLAGSPPLAHRCKPG